MRAAAVLPRSAIRLMFLLGLQTNAGMVDDVRRVARPWEFDIEQVALSVRVRAWHADGDRQVPSAPWRDVKGIELTIVPGDFHEFPVELWETALRRTADDSV